MRGPLRRSAFLSAEALAKEEARAGYAGTNGLDGSRRNALFENPDIIVDKYTLIMLCYLYGDPLHAPKYSTSEPGKSLGTFFNIPLARGIGESNP